MPEQARSAERPSERSERLDRLVSLKLVASTQIAQNVHVLPIKILVIRAIPHIEQIEAAWRLPFRTRGTTLTFVIHKPGATLISFAVRPENFELSIWCIISHEFFVFGQKDAIERDIRESLDDFGFFELSTLSGNCNIHCHYARYANNPDRLSLEHIRFLLLVGQSISVSIFRAFLRLTPR